jgi:thermitase
MRRVQYSYVALLVAVVFLVASCGSGGAGIEPPGTTQQAGTTQRDGATRAKSARALIAAVGQHAEGRLLVKFNVGVSEDQKAQAHRRAQARVAGAIPQIGVYIVSVPPADLETSLQSYLSDPAVEFAEPDGRYSAADLVIPNDPLWYRQYGPLVMQARQAWDITTGSRATRIAILDTGIDRAHPDLASKVVGGADFTGEGLFDGHGHGTHVAGIASAVTDNRLVIAGMDWQARLLDVKVLNTAGWGLWTWIAAGLIWAADNGAHVANMSLGGPFPAAVVLEAVRYAASRNVFMACAAGNDGTTNPFYPAAFKLDGLGCNAIGATDAPPDVGSKAQFSQYGRWVDYGAPGVLIWSTLPANRYAAWSGTSMAAPHIAGLAGLLRADGVVRSTQIRRCIMETTDPVVQNPWARGRANAWRAVATCP